MDADGSFVIVVDSLFVYVFSVISKKKKNTAAAAAPAICLRLMAVASDVAVRPKAEMDALLGKAPPEYICGICEKLMRFATATPCCNTDFCDDCKWRFVLMCYWVYDLVAAAPFGSVITPCNQMSRLG